MIVEIIITIVALLAIFKSLLMIRKRKISLPLALFWIVLWTTALFVVNIPQFNSSIIDWLGRDISMILFLNILFLYYLNLLLYVKITKNKEEITKLVRDSALSEKK